MKKRTTEPYESWTHFFDSQPLSQDRPLFHANRKNRYKCYTYKLLDFKLIYIKKSGVMCQ